jgi:hypothetical protein
VAVGCSQRSDSPWDRRVDKSYACLNAKRIPFLDVGADPTGAGTEDDDPVRQEHRLFDVVRDQDDHSCGETSIDQRPEPSEPLGDD